MIVIQLHQEGKDKVQEKKESPYGEFIIIRHTGIRPRFSLEERKEFDTLTGAFESVRDLIDSSEENVIVIYEFTNIDNHYDFIPYKPFTNGRVEEVVNYMEKSTSFLCIVYIVNKKLLLIGNIPIEDSFFRFLTDELKGEMSLNFDIEV